MNLFKESFWSDELIFRWNIKITPVKTFNKTAELSAEGILQIATVQIQSGQDECAMR